MELLVVLTEDNFNISREEVTNEITAILTNIPEDKCNLIINNLYGVDKLFIKSFSNIFSISIENINNKQAIILNNLPIIKNVDLINSDIILILEDGLQYLSDLEKNNSVSSEIVDNNKILTSLNIFNDEGFILDENFSNIKYLYIGNSKFQTTFRNYNNLKHLYLHNAKGKFNNINFKNLKKLNLTITDKFELEFNNCNFDSIEYLDIILYENVKIEEVNINSIFKNIKKNKSYFPF